MKKLIAIMSMVLIASVASAASAGYNVGFNSKLVEQGVVTGTSLVTAGANVEVGSFGLAVDTFSTLDSDAGVTGVRGSDGWLKRVDLTASYKFTSTLVDVTLGAKYKNASRTFAFGGVKDNVTPFVTFGGNAFTVIPWHVTATIDDKNNNNNFEGFVEFPVPANLGKLKVVPTLGVGFNDSSIKKADLVKSGLRALDETDKYYHGGVALAYPTIVGEARVGTFIQTSGFDSDAKKAYGWTLSLVNKF